MKHLYIIVALAFGFVGINGMDRECRVKLSEWKLIKDDSAEFNQKMYRMDIIGNSVGVAVYSTAGLAVLFSKKMRQSPQARIAVPFAGTMVMMHSFFLCKNVKDYNFAKYGLKEHRELVIE